MTTFQSHEACSLDMSLYPGYYQDGHYDNTPATYISGYAVALTACICALLLWHSRAKSEAALQHTRSWFCAKLVLMSVSAALAGFVQQGLFGTAGDVHQSTANKSLWFVGESLEIFSGSCGICAGLAAIILVNERKRHFKAYAATMALSSVLIILLGTCVGVDFFIITGFFGDISANFMLVTCVLLWRCQHAVPVRLLKGKVAFALALILSCLGNFTLVAFGSVCGVPCPMDCPLPSPGFNHNATVHVVQTAALCLFAFGMHKVCLCMELQARRQQSQRPLGFDFESAGPAVPSMREELLDASNVLKPKLDEPVPPTLPRTMAIAAASAQQLECDEPDKDKKEPASVSTVASSAPSLGPSPGSLARSLSKFLRPQPPAGSSVLSSRASSLLTGSSEASSPLPSLGAGSASSMLTGSSEVPVASRMQSH